MSAQRRYLIKSLIVKEVNIDDVEIDNAEDFKEKLKHAISFEKNYFFPSKKHICLTIGGDIRSFKLQDMKKEYALEQVDIDNLRNKFRATVEPFREDYILIGFEDQ